MTQLNASLHIDVFFFFLVLTGKKIVHPSACFFSTTLTRNFRIISESYHYVHEIHIN